MSVSKMKANIETLKNDLWDYMMDMNVTNDKEQFIALLYHLTANEGQQDWDDVDNMIGKDYLVLTDNEADRMVGNYIEETVGMFNPSFLSDYTGIDEDVFVTLQKAGKYDAVKQIVLRNDNSGAFALAAVQADGRGHFLATYDFNEHEVTVNDTTYYIYRVN